MKKMGKQWAVAAASALLLGSAGLALAGSSYFGSQCSGCHTNVTATCAGCHAHGVHPGDKTKINLVAKTNKTSYKPGENMSVTLEGGYRSPYGWVRVYLYDNVNAEGKPIACSTAPGATDCNGKGGGQSLLPPGQTPVLTISKDISGNNDLKAPMTPGEYTYSVSWYGNRFDASNGAFDLPPSKWRKDEKNWDPQCDIQPIPYPRPNMCHGEQIVPVASFTVTNTPASAEAPTEAAATVKQASDSAAPAVAKK